MRFVSNSYATGNPVLFEMKLGNTVMKFVWWSPKDFSIFGIEESVSHKVNQQVSAGVRASVTESLRTVQNANTIRLYFQRSTQHELRNAEEE